MVLLINRFVSPEPMSNVHNCHPQKKMFFLAEEMEKQMKIISTAAFRKIKTKAIWASS